MAELTLRKQKIGTQRPSVTNTEVENQYLTSKLKSPSVAMPEEIDAQSAVRLEGAIRVIKVNVFERGREARSAYLQKHGNQCSVRRMSYNDAYDEEFVKLTQIQHLKPIPEVRGH